MKKEKRAPRGILWRILLALFGIILFTVLELGRHTLAGWIAASVLIAVYAIVRIKPLRGKGRAVRLVSWLCLFALTAGVLALSWPPVRNVPAVRGENGGKTDVYTVAQGDLTGVYTADGKVEVFAGVPYAEPPVGDLRWREPVPAGAWEGVLEADSFAPMSMQTRNLPIFYSVAQIVGYHDYKITFDDNYREPVSEDSLYLNIWKPAGDVRALPVLVYIHGGSLQTGQPWYEDYSGESLAREGVVVVNMGYRLGVFGFFASPELAAESENVTTGNYGLLDQIEALKWVKENISSFGGNPDNVTLAGESAGAACVSALCTSPLAKGLFRRAVVESSTVASPSPAHSFRTLDDAYAAAPATLERFGVKTVEELRGIPADKLASEMDYHHHITVDGYVLEETPYESYLKGVHNEEALLHGYNRYEAAPFILFDGANLKNYESKINSFFGDELTPRVLSLYPASTDKEAADNWADIYTAYYFTYGHRCLDRLAVDCGVPTYTYHFTKNNRRLGAWHSGEQVYLYGNIPEDSSLYDEADRALSETMLSYFVNFIKSGDPNGEGLPVWQPSAADGTVMELGSTVAPQKSPFAPVHDLLDELFGWE